MRQEIYDMIRVECAEIKAEIPEFKQAKMVLGEIVDNVMEECSVDESDRDMVHDHTEAILRDIYGAVF